MFSLPEYYLRGVGTIHIGDRDLSTGGLSEAGLTFIGDASEFTLEPDQYFAEHLEHQTGDGRKDIRLPNATYIDGQITLDSTAINNFKLFLRGRQSASNSATITNEIHNAPAAGKSFLLNSPVETFISLTNADGDPFVPWTDYWTDGRVVSLPITSAAAYQSVRANYVSANATQIDIFGDRFADLYLYFNGLNTANREWFAVELFKVSFDPAAIGDLLGDEIVKLTLPFEALFEPLKSTANLGGFGNIYYELAYLLKTSAETVSDGNSFTITFYGEAPADYTINGVESADIGGAPLTGTFTASGEQLTFTAADGWKIFDMSLDNGKASVQVRLLGDLFKNEGIYCNRNLRDLYSYFLGFGVYCSQDTTGYIANPITGTGVYCSQDLAQL